MRQKKVLIAEVELHVDEVWERELEEEYSGPDRGNDGRGEPAEHIILEVGRPANGRAADLLGRVLGDEERLAVVLTRSTAGSRRDSELWSPRACILDASRMERLKAPADDDAPVPGEATALESEDSDPEDDDITVRIQPVAPLLRVGAE